MTLVNCFRRLSFAEFPAVAKSFTACAVLTDGVGTHKLTLSVLSLRDFQEVWTYSWNVDFSSPLAEQWAFMRVRNCVFPEDGSYQLELTINGESVARTVLRILAA